ncbi:hypothetical protein A306_00000436 [Columba livia]|uniref:Zinc finger protein 593 n=1 Tax=Columba livia TaxID=8932 RepID=A0A2I0LJ58_COLLI|nr:hypothetical protein A306_00000436 [Columba livia]
MARGGLALGACRALAPRWGSPQPCSCALLCGPDQHEGAFRSKVHKKRLKQLREAPYTQEEAERAAGMGSYIPPKKVEVQTQPLDEVVAMEASS